MNNQRRAEKKFSAERTHIMLADAKLPMNRYQRANTQAQAVRKEATGHTAGHQ
ncbi:hypothetical protein [Arthrobacter sp. NPDC056727]|uniref:hypothetical protein n=1 Tax=Arthrobacter sp. NPDC056727 TaxID=3345927 RepID=UPI00366AD4DB